MNKASQSLALRQLRKAGFNDLARQLKLHLTTQELRIQILGGGEPQLNDEELADLCQTTLHRLRPQKVISPKPPARNFMTAEMRALFDQITREKLGLPTTNRLRK